ncbi:MAG: hypothetical protein N3A69_08670 [Leptospiraceae bacterium]|nr:hypothetical protein [Leptospiraceae bacterium]
MRFILGIILIVLSPSTVSQNVLPNSTIRLTNSNKNSMIIAKNLSEDMEYEDETEDNELSAGQIRTSKAIPKNTKSSNRPGIPTSNSDWKKLETEIDPERRKQLTIQGLKTIEALEEKGNSSAVRQISRILLSHSLPEVRARAAQSLGKLGKGVRSLHKAIDTDGYQVRQEAYKSLEKLGQRQSLKYFLKGIKSTDPEIRISCFRGLGKTKSSIARNILLKEGISSPDHTILAASLIGLGYFSRKEDIELFKKYLDSEVTDVKSAAVIALGISKIPVTTHLLLKYYETNPSMEPDVIHALSQKKNLAGTLALIKIMNNSKNENYQGMIQKELYLRRAFGNYAIVKTNTATLRKFHKASSEKVAILQKGDVAKIRKATEKLYKATMNKEILEDRYYLLQVVNMDSQTRKQIIQGWVFGPKIEVINLTPPQKEIKEKSTTFKKPSDIADESSEEFDEDSEDEAGAPPTKKEIIVPFTKKETPQTSGEAEFYDEDEDE